MTDTTDLQITLLNANQSQPEVTVNDAIYELEAATASLLVHDMTADADYTLGTTGSPQEWQYSTIEITDTGTVLTAARNIVCPNNRKLYVFVNSTAQALTLKTAAGTGVSVAAGMTAILRCDGTNVVRVTADA